MNRSQRRWSTLAAAFAVLALTSCTNDKPNPADNTDRGSAAVQNVPHADAKRLTTEHAERTATWMGNNVKLEPNPTTTANACDGKPAGHYYIQGIYQILLPGEQHVEALKRLTSRWQQEGYQIRKERTFPNGKGGEATATNPKDNFAISITSGEPPAMLLLVNSPCYKSNEEL
jgi:hypothetical protein